MLRLWTAQVVRASPAVGVRSFCFAARAKGTAKGAMAAANDRRNRSRRGRPLPSPPQKESRATTVEEKEGEEERERERERGGEEEGFNLYELQTAESESAAAEMLEEAILERSGATEMDIEDCYPQAERDVSFLDFEATGVVRPDPDAAPGDTDAAAGERREPSAKMRELIARFDPRERQGPRKKFPYVSRDVTKCRGCGVTLQSEREEELGFVPRPRTRKKLRVCRRCWYLQHHNREPPLKEGHRRSVLQQESSAAQLLRAREATEGESPTVALSGERESGGEGKDFATGILDEELRGAVARDVRHFLSSLLPQRMCLVVHVVDLNDLAPESFLNDLSSTIGDNEVMVVGNKADLLPPGTSDLRLREWLRTAAKQHCNLQELPLKNVQLVSSLRGRVKAAVDVMEELRKRRDVFVVGSVNSGKSTFINSVLMQLGIGGIKHGRGSALAWPRPRCKDAGQYNRKYGLTTSAVPGTTLDTISLPLKSGGFLHDTPGIQLHNALPSLRTEERNMVVPKKQVKPRIYQLREGKSIFLGGLGRVDYLFGPPMFLSVCTSHMLPLHLCDLNDAERVTNKRLGRDICPPILAKGSERITMGAEMEGSEGERGEEKERERLWQLLNKERETPLPAMAWREFVFEQGSKRSQESFADIVLPGVGWVSVTGASTVPVVLQAGVMHGSGAYSRAPLMPFEARAAARKAYGAKKHGKLSDYVPPYTKHPDLLARTLDRSPFLRQRVREGLPLASPAASHPPGAYAEELYAAPRVPVSNRGRAKAAGAYGAATEVQDLFADFERAPTVVHMEPKKRPST